MEKYSQLSNLDDTPIAQTKPLSYKNCETRIRRPNAGQRKGIINNLNYCISCVKYNNN